MNISMMRNMKGGSDAELGLVAGKAGIEFVDVEPKVGGAIVMAARAFFALVDTKVLEHGGFGRRGEGLAGEFVDLLYSRNRIVDEGTHGKVMNFGMWVAFPVVEAAVAELC